ncbi:MAG: zinc ribbon domain-containing protein [Deltaproteobacteria bacterium]|nr:zinc ribbon domain-containing protein [Deltaproteobacteria bacterium]
MSACTRCQTLLELGDLRCASCALPVPMRTTDTPAARARILRCTDCNAAVAFDANRQAPHCGFCGATMVIEQPADPIEVAAVRIPFSVSREGAEASLRGWLGKRGYFAPAALHEEAVLESLTPLCWAGWLVSAQATVAWTADSDEGARRSSWAPHAGQLPMRFDAVVVPASRGLDREECRLLTPYYDLRAAVAIDAVVAGDVPAMVESFDAQRSAARAIVQRAITATAKTRVEPAIPGRRFRNVHAACLLEGQTTDRLALPAWVLAYRYRGRPYRAIVHGQRPEVVFGSSPIDRERVAGLVLAIIGLIGLIGAFIVWLR